VHQVLKLLLSSQMLGQLIDQKNTLPDKIYTMKIQVRLSMFKKPLDLKKITTI